MRWRSHLLLAVLVTGCVWRGYDRVLSIHLDVLAGMADKMVSIAEVGRRPTSNDMTEMLYPLERGRLFLRQYERRAGEDSYRQFAQLLDRYAALLENSDPDIYDWLTDRAVPPPAAETDVLQLLRRFKVHEARH